MPQEIHGWLLVSADCPLTVTSVLGGILATRAKTLSIKIQGNEKNDRSGSMGLDLTHGWLGESGRRGIYPTSWIPWQWFIFLFPLLRAQNGHVLPRSCGRGFRVWNFARFILPSFGKIAFSGSEQCVTNQHPFSCGQNSRQLLQAAWKTERSCCKYSICCSRG